MTRIRRPAKQQGLTLVSVCFSVLAISIIVVSLFHLDGFPARKRKSNPAITPEKLLAEELIRKRDVEVAAANNNNAAQEEENGGGGQDEDGQEDELARRRFVFQLANLKGRDVKTNTGKVVIETRPDWAPLGAAHFHALMEARFYESCRFFRVVRNFIVQFGIAGDPKVQQHWRKDVIKDDPVVQSNTRGTLTFATSGKNTRTTQLFINLKDNKYLDKEGFSPIGEVIEGMEFVDQINDEYKEKPGQGKIQNRGNAYLEEEFPNLSYISDLHEITEEEAGVVAAEGEEQ